MTKRLFDILFSVAALLITGPVILVALLLIFLQDRRNPFFFSERIGAGGKPFRMIKVRTMVVDAHRTAIDSTQSNDPRITRLGAIIRRFKVDEFTQFLNVLLGHLSVVGPRPNVRREIEIYTEKERRLLTVKPGVTDLSSVVFFDLAQVLDGYPDANIAYNQLVRPWKSRLGLLYIDHQSFGLDIYIIFLTVLSYVARATSLKMVQETVGKLGGEKVLVRVCGRQDKLSPYPPPGATSIVTARVPVH